MSKYSYIKQLFILIFIILPVTIYGVVNAIKTDKAYKEQEKKHKESYKLRKEIIKYLKDEYLPELITKSYEIKLYNALYYEEKIEDENEYTRYSSSVIYVSEGFDITIHFCFFGELDSDMAIGKKKADVSFFFNDVCKAIEKKFGTKANRYKGVKSLEHEYNIQVDKLEELYSNENGFMNESIRESMIYGKFLESVNEGIINRN